MAIRVRELTEEERSQIERLASSRTAPARAVERAQIVRLAAEGRAAPDIAERLRLNPQTVRDWLKRFNAEGLAGLDDRPRSGKPPTYTPDQAGEVVAAALSDPQALGLPFACWTLDRLAAHLSESKGIADQAQPHQRDCWWPRACAGGSRRPGSARRWTRSSPKKGAHREPLHRPARRQRSGLPGRDGARERQEFRRAAAGTGAPPRRTGPPSGPGRRSTTGGAAVATSSARSARPPARRSPGPTAGAPSPTGWTS